MDGKRRSDQLDKLISLYDLNDDSKSRLRNLVEKYEHETDEELERKRKVYLSHVVKHTQDEIAEGAKDTSFNRAAYEGLSLVVRGRQRVQSGRESRRFFATVVWLCRTVLVRVNGFASLEFGFWVWKWSGRMPMLMYLP